MDANARVRPQQDEVHRTTVTPKWTGHTRRGQEQYEEIELYKDDAQKQDHKKGQCIQSRWLDQWRAPPTLGAGLRLLLLWWPLSVLAEGVQFGLPPHLLFGQAERVVLVRCSRGRIPAHAPSSRSEVAERPPSSPHGEGDGAVADGRPNSPAIQTQERQPTCIRWAHAPSFGHNHAQYTEKRLVSQQQGLRLRQTPAAV